MMIEGLSHITLTVSNLERSSKIILGILGGTEIQKNYSVSKEAFFNIAGVWLVLIEDPVSATRTYDHIAFKISSSDIPVYLKKLEDMGLEIKPSRKRRPEEGESIYFYDYDNHLFELHAGTLADRLKIP